MAPASTDSLALRVASALVLAPAALAAVWFGGLWLRLLVGIAAALMGWEWARLCRVGSAGAAAAVILTAVLAAIAAALGWPAAGALAALVGSIAVQWMARRRGLADAHWVALGTFWIAIPGVSFLYLAAAPTAGRSTLLWLLAVVWATDIGAYAAGRSIGGPRLAPRLSPKKTWAGFFGGLAAATLAGLAAAFWTGGAPAVVVPSSIGLAIVAQVGDLAESLTKRHFGVKDSSGLIPGHGGLLDRLDSILTAGAALALATLLTGASPLLWHF